MENLKDLKMGRMRETVTLKRPVSAFLFCSENFRLPPEIIAGHVIITVPREHYCLQSITHSASEGWYICRSVTGRDGADCCRNYCNLLGTLKNAKGNKSFSQPSWTSRSAQSHDVSLLY